MSDAPQHVHPVTRDGPGDAYDDPPEKVRAGAARQRSWNAFSDGAGRFHAGHWQSGVTTLAVRYTETELCVLVEGRVRLTDAAGRSADYGPGDAFVIAAGFEGTWQSLEPVTKIYAILEPG